ncbi:maleylpyruvate isomerase family mycothiol-dependent enzyme [Allokutzneria oryzae]|uniref:Maleylpyruvate isomerase family mycothiol-dependent enzyme n=1 Tax=Allokutzneria oryzae TaxID=1378989 RepID=A0ABV5ZY87_9PSEU
MYDVIYRDARMRISAIAETLDERQLALPVAACPEWSVRALLAHLPGVAHDAATGRMDGAPGKTWTERHVGERLARTVTENLMEWAGFSDRLEERLRQEEAQLNMVHDVTQHEADLRSALGLERLPDEAWRPMLSHIANMVGSRRKATGALVVRANEDEWRIGEGEVVATVEAEPYELWRAFFGRRSTGQMRGWKWDCDPEPYLDRIPVFPARADALAEK